VLRDLTLPLGPNTPLYPGDPAPALERVSDLARGDALTASELRLNLHVGTHVDAPGHFLAGGALVADLPLERFCGPARVLDLRGRKRIEPADLAAQAPPRAQHLLLRTDNAPLLRGPFTPSYAHLSREAAEYLAGLEPLSVGIDYYSVDPPDAPEGFPAHLALARAGVPVFVCLDLGAVEPGAYRFTALPLPLCAAEASPVRAVLFPAG
jgi:arylformamidase